jgi:hypothetical protein
MGGLHRFIKPTQELQTSGRNPGPHRSSVLSFAAAGDQFAFLQSVEQASDIRIPGYHSAGDFSAGKSLRCASQNAEHVVLRRREILEFENLC